MIQSKYVEGVTVPDFDKAVSKIVRSYGIEGGGKPMKVGIENFDGQLYRVLNAVGLGAYMHVVTKLPKLGLEDTLEDSINGKNGYDSWFITTPAMKVEVEPVAEVRKDAATDLLSELSALGNVPETERESIVLSRVGQGVFRSKLIAHWKGCAVTGAECVPLLKASHIKPWRDSNNEERLDMFNGLLLLPNLDAAFDAGYISFDQNGKILLSRSVAGSPAFQLHLHTKMKLNAKLLQEQHHVYLEYHRSHVFLG